MTPDDPRHGSEAGHEQHHRDGEKPCAPCVDAKLRASRRRTKRKTMGYRYTLPLGDLHQVLTQWQAGGASLNDIARHVGISDGMAWRLINGGPDYTVYARTAHRIDEKRYETPLTTAGVTRRIQALTWLGYSVIDIADAAQVNQDTILDARPRPREYVAAHVKTGVAAAYDKLHMRIPEGESRQDRAGITRLRNMARRNGYLPPLAWTDIDNAAERPVGWEYRAGDYEARRELLIDLDERGAGITAVCRALRVKREAVEKWCERHDMSPLFSRLIDRENPNADRHRNWRNGGAEGGVA